MKKNFFLIGLVCFMFSASMYGQITVNAGKASLGRMQLSQLDESLKSYSIFTMGDVEKFFSGKGKVKVLMNLGNEFQWDLELEDNNSLISADYKATMITENGEIELPKPDIKLFKSKDPDNMTRIAVYDGIMSGVIEKDGERYAITPLSTFMADNARRLVVYNEKDIKKEAKKHLASPIEEELDKMVQTRAADFTNTVRIIKVGTHADYAFYNKYGKNASTVRNSMIDAINKAEAIYSIDLNIRFSVSHTSMFTDSNADKNEFGYYEIANVPNEASHITDQKHKDRGAAYFGNIRRYWSLHSADRDIMIVFSGNDFGRVGGMAHTGSMQCARKGQNYAFVEDDNFTYLTVAHEAGHIFGANDITDGSIMHDCEGYRFSIYSINEIKSHLSGIDCIQTVPIPQISRIEGAIYPRRMPTRYGVSPSTYNSATCEWSISPYAPIQSMNGYNTDVIIDFSSGSGSSYSLSCIPVASVDVSGKVYKIRGKGAYLNVLVSSSYQIYNDNESIRIVPNTTENAEEFVFSKTSASLAYSLSNALTGVLADKGTVNKDNGTINVSRLPKGIYVLTLTSTNGNTESHKLSIQ